MVATQAVEDRWLERLNQQARLLKLPALLRPELGNSLSTTALVLVVARLRLRSRESGRLRRPDLTIQGDVTMIRLPPPSLSDDLAEAVSACNAIARAEGWAERMGCASLGSGNRTLDTFRTGILDPLLALTGSAATGPRPSTSLGRATVGECKEWGRSIRLEAIALSRFERADDSLHEWIAEWLSEVPPAPPYLVLDHRVGRHTVLLTNCPPPAGR